MRSPRSWSRKGEHQPGGSSTGFVLAASLSLETALARTVVMKILPPEINTIPLYDTLHG